jgi:hypothetical protein
VVGCLVLLGAGAVEAAITKHPERPRHHSSEPVVMPRTARRWAGNVLTAWRSSRTIPLLRQPSANVLIERKLGTWGTARNWNTVLKLGALARDREKHPGASR